MPNAGIFEAKMPLTNTALSNRCDSSLLWVTQPCNYAHGG